MKRIICLLAAAVLAMASIGSLTACKKKKIDTDTHIEIYAYNAGYGMDWIFAAAEAFTAKKAEEGVTVTFDIDGDSLMQQETLIAAGPNNTTVDLFIAGGRTGAALARMGDTVLKGYDNVVEPLDEVYSAVMENGQTYEEKMLENSRPEKVNGHYYDVPWVHSLMGILYNQDLFTKAGITQTPRTTAELVEVCNTLKQKGYEPFVFSSDTGYWNYLRDVWWMQYEGAQGISNFYNGISVDAQGNLSRSKEIFRQPGRLESLYALYELIEYKPSGDFIHENVNTMTFTDAQAEMILGNGVMIPNGDWFENEMKSVEEEDKNHYDIRFLPTPVLSSLAYIPEGASDSDIRTPKCKVINTEELLRAVIDVVDQADKTGEADFSPLQKLGVDTESEEFLSDYEVIRDARHMYNTSSNLCMFIPVYATAKDIAKEFLIFLGSDEGLRIFIDNTSGNQMPFSYDLEGDAERWNKLSEMQKVSYEFKKTGIFFNQYSKGSLVIEPYNNGANISEIYFTAKNQADHKTPRMLFDAEYEYWTDARWTQLLQMSGV